MQTQVEHSPSRRRSLRRAVRLEAQVESKLWEGTVPLLATNVSGDGVWLETDLPLEVGEELIVSLAPPRWPSPRPLTARAAVTRVGMFRRRHERARSGMGLAFVDLDRHDALWLRAALRGLPPPLPARHAELRARGLVPPEASPELVLADGSRYTLRAEAALLTAYRPAVEQAPLPAPAVPLGSPMTAILRVGARPARHHGRAQLA